MNKTVKKLDNNVVKALTRACEQAKSEFAGFEWLTHSANYANFPTSLVVTCVFTTDDSLRDLLNHQQDKKFRQLIQTHLLKVGVLLKDVRQNVCFDTEQACLAQHQGDWKSRLG